MDAVNRPDLADVDALLLGGQSPDVRAPYADRLVTRGKTFDVSPLFVAVARGDDNITRLLLTVADLSRLENREALCAAAYMGRHELLNRLLRHGVEPSDLACTMYGGPSPAELADSRRYSAIAAGLREGVNSSNKGTLPSLSNVIDVSR
jgi:hypothetical protein